MTELKKTIHNHQENQQQHLEQMNEQLRQYLETAQQSAVQMNTALQQRAVAVAPQFSPTDGYVLPQPQPLVAPETLRDQSSFERAAAASVGLEAPLSVAPESQPSVLRKMAVTPQQIGLAAVRRVVPVVRAYSRPPKPADTHYASGASAS